MKFDHRQILISPLAGVLQLKHSPLFLTSTMHFQQQCKCPQGKTALDRSLSQQTTHKMLSFFIIFIKAMLCRWSSSLKMSLMSLLLEDLASSESTLMRKQLLPYTPQFLVVIPLMVVPMQAPQPGTSTLENFPGTMPMCLAAWKMLLSEVQSPDPQTFPWTGQLPSHWQVFPPRSLHMMLKKNYPPDSMMLSYCRYGTALSSFYLSLIWCLKLKGRDDGQDISFVGNMTYEDIQ